MVPSGLPVGRMTLQWFKVVNSTFGCRILGAMLLFIKCPCPGAKICASIWCTTYHCFVMLPTGFPWDLEAALCRLKCSELEGSPTGELRKWTNDED